MPDVACLNGEFGPLAEARVSANDRGFLFGDGVYEVVRTYNRTPFLLEAHLDRLERSLAAVKITPDWNRATLTGQIDQLLAQADYPESKLYIQVTRGVAPRLHSFPDASPTLYLSATRIVPPDPDRFTRGVTAIRTPDIRWARCDIKSLNLLPNVMAQQAAREVGAFEALFVDDDEQVWEGATSNVLVVMDGTLITPPLGKRLLAGVSRAHLLAAARADGIPVEERTVTLTELQQADEVLLSGTTIEVLPVREVAGIRIGNGRPGPMAAHLLNLFRPDGATATEAG